MKASQTNERIGKRKSIISQFAELPKAVRWIIVISFVLRIAAFVVFLAMGGDGVENDTATYTDSAIEFTKFFRFEQTAFRTPGYPFIIAVFMSILGSGYYYGLVFFQIVMNVLGVWYVYRFAKLLDGRERVAIVALVLTAFNPFDIMYTFKVLTDSVSQSLLLISIYYFAEYIKSLQDKKPKLCPLVVSSILLAINVLIRPSVMYLPLALALGAAIVAIICKTYKQVIVSVLCLCILTQTPVVLWSRRNVAVEGYNGYSTVSEINLYYYNAAEIYAKQNGMSYYDAREALENREDEVMAEYMETMTEYEAARKRGMELIFSDLPHYITCCVRNCGLMALYPGSLAFDFVSEPISEVMSAVKDGAGISGILQNLNATSIFSVLVIGGNVLLLGILALCAWFGMFGSFRKNWIMAMLILGVVAYGYFVSCHPVGVGSYSRFRLAYSMLTAIFSAVGIECVISFFAKRKMRRETKKDEGVI